MIFHLHIPKTGGSSLITLLEREYGENYQRVPNWQPHTLSIWNYNWGNPEKLAQKKCISGHYFFGFWKALNDVLPEYKQINNPYFITFIREPIERLLSLYHYWRVNENRYQSILLNMSFDKFISSNNKEWYFLDNSMVRRIAGTEKPRKKITEVDYRRAIKNLEYFPLVGLTDQFDESLERWQKIFGWKDIKYKHKLNQPDRLKKENLSRNTINKVRRIQKYDYLLYQYVLDKWWTV